MPKRDKAPVGAPCWIDLMTSDTTRAQAFYGELLGWAAEVGGPEYGGYITFSKDGIVVAGCMGKTPEMGEMPDVWSTYLATADIEATAEAVVANGGAVYVPPMDIMDLGKMAVFGDAGQAAVGVWEPGLHQGFGMFAEPGSPSWFELHTRAYDASVQFYQEVFGWDTTVVSDSPEFRYTTLGEDDCALAGIMDSSAFLPEGVPAHWAVYFEVDDVDASASKVVELGGALVLAAENTPYGRIAQAADPTGAMFRLRGPVTE